MITTANLNLRTRELADLVNSNFVTDPELDYFIAFASKRLYDILIDSFEEFYVKSEVKTITSGNELALPTDFYKLRGLDYNVGGKYVEIPMFNFNERNRSSSAYYGYYNTGLKYRLLGNKIFITPDDGATGSYRVWYIPLCNVETAGFDGFNGYEDYIIIDAAIRCKLKAEEDVSSLYAMKQEILKLIKEASKNRDIGEPKTVRDMTSRGFNGDCL